MENFDKYYRSYKYMEKLLQTDFTHNYLNQNFEDNDKGEDVLSGRINQKVIDMEWVTAIEDTLVYMERAIDEQRRFIKENQEVYRANGKTETMSFCGGWKMKTLRDKWIYLTSLNIFHQVHKNHRVK